MVTDSGCTQSRWWSNKEAERWHRLQWWSNPVRGTEQWGFWRLDGKVLKVQTHQDQRRWENTSFSKTSIVFFQLLISLVWLLQVLYTWSLLRSLERKRCTSSRWTIWGSWQRLPTKKTHLHRGSKVFWGPEQGLLRVRQLDRATELQKAACVWHMRHICM